MKLFPDEEAFLRHWIYDEAHYQDGRGPAKRLQLEHRAIPADLATLIAVAIPDPLDQEAAGIGPPPPEPPIWPWTDEKLRARLAEARDMLSIVYDDEYATCSKTYAILMIKHSDPSTITERLGIEPSRSQRKGESIHPYHTRTAPFDGWFLSTKGLVESRDSRRHIDWLLDRVAGKTAEILRLQAEGCEMDVWCYWLSACGQGGPTISPEQMRKLGALNLELLFDIYGPVEDAPASHLFPMDGS